MIRISQLRLPLPYQEADVLHAVKKTLRLPKNAQFKMRILKKSIDSRHRPALSAVLTVGVSDIQIHGKNEEEALVCQHAHARNAALFTPKEYYFPVGAGQAEREMPAASIPEEKRPVIVGFGPAGIFAALELARAGLRPIVLERGKMVAERTKDVSAFWKTGKLDPSSNVQFGEGGAGTFSDGKLATGIGDKEGRIQEVLGTFVRNGAPEDILWDQHPHLGTDVLAKVIPSIREEIKSLGAEIFFGCQLRAIVQRDGHVSAIRFANEQGIEKERACENLILAIGHSARDTFRMLEQEGVLMTAKPFAVGVRCEHTQSLIDEYAYGAGNTGDLRRKQLGVEAASYKLTENLKSGRGVYSFCMCPGGYVVNASSEPGRLCVNGMSYSGRSGTFANSALVVTVGPKDFGPGTLAGLSFQERLEEAAYKAAGGKIPVQLLADFKENKISTGLGQIQPDTKGGWAFGDVRGSLPSFVADGLLAAFPVFEKKIHGFAADDVLLLGVEARTSSPVRMLRGEDLESPLTGLFPCGEGAGYAGGITSAAVDGIRVAESVAAKLRS